MPRLFASQRSRLVQLPAISARHDNLLPGPTRKRATPFTRQNTCRDETGLATERGACSPRHFPSQSLRTFLPPPEDAGVAHNLHVPASATLLHTVVRVNQLPHWDLHRVRAPRRPRRQPQRRLTYCCASRLAPFATSASTVSRWPAPAARMRADVYEPCERQPGSQRSVQPPVAQLLQHSSARGRKPSCPRDSAVARKARGPRLCARCSSRRPPSQAPRACSSAHANDHLLIHVRALLQAGKHLGRVPLLGSLLQRHRRSSSHARLERLGGE